MTHSLFRKDIFIETAFARRFQAMLRSALDNRTWHVIVADPGAGKTYNSKMQLGADGNLQVSGCVLVFCQSQAWRRAP